MGDGVATRLPAAELEEIVKNELTAFLSDSSKVRSLVSDASTHRLAAMINHARELGDQVTAAAPAELQILLRSLEFKLRVERNGIVASIDRAILLQRASIDEDDGDRITISIPCSFETYGHEQRLRLDPPVSDVAKPDDELLDLLTRAFDARELLLTMSKDETVAMSSTALQHLRRIARISYLAPAIIKSILDGTQPRDLISRDLWRIGTLPVAWRDQKSPLDFPVR